MSDLLLMYSEGPPSPGHVARLGAFPGVESVSVARSEDEALEAALKAEVFIGQRYLRQCLAVATRLRWVQSTAAGIDHLLTPELARAAPILTRCPIFSDTIARHAFALALAVSRRIPESVDAQRSAEWRRPATMLPWPATAMVIGVGGIGSSLARLLKSVGVRVIGVDRHSPEGVTAVDELLGLSQWRRALVTTDWLFLAIPGEPENRHFLDGAALESLPSHAVVVNVGRGLTVDTEALAARLRGGLLGGAALDVTEPDPLPESHWLWSVPRLLITPKVATFGPERMDRLEAFVEAQVLRYLRGETPDHAVDLKPSVRLA